MQVTLFALVRMGQRFSLYAREATAALHADVGQGFSPACT
jgi:hypothetical protein